MLAFVSAWGASQSLSLVGWIQLPFGGAVMGYVGGSLPAFLTGVIAAGASALIPSKALWVASATVVGAIASAVAFDAMGAPLSLVIIGAAFAFAAALVGLQVRPRQSN